MLDLAMPKLGVNVTIGKCQTDEHDCMALKNLALVINSNRYNLYSNYNKTISEIFRSFPENKDEFKKKILGISRTGRSVKAIVDVASTIVPFIFGINDWSERIKIKRHIRTLNRMLTKLRTDQVTMGGTLNSFAHLTTDAMESVQRGLARNAEFQRNTSHKFREQDASIFSLFSVANNINIDLKVERAITDLENGLTTLLQGQLSPFLLPYEDVLSTVKAINQKLRSISPYLKVLHKSPYSFYTKSEFAVHREDDKIMVHVSFVVANTDYIGVLYEVIHFDSILNGSSTDVSRLINPKNFVAFSNDNKFVAEMGTWDQESIFVPLVHSETNCYFSIFKDFRDRIRQYCDYEILINGASSSVNLIDEGVAILSKIDKYEIDCKHPVSYNVFEGCSLCMIQLPCMCAMKVSDPIVAHIPPKLTNCIYNYSNVHHISNIPIILHRYGVEASDLLTANSTRQEVFVNLYEDYSFVQNSENKVLSMADYVKRLNKSYGIQVLDSIQNLNDSSANIWTLINSCVLLLLIAIVSLMGYKIYSLHIMVVASWSPPGGTL